MVYPEDRVLVGVINTKRDLGFMLDEAWYRIPVAQMPDGVYFEYIAFYLSRTAARGKPESGIHYFARNAGYELAFRRDLIPSQSDHPRADNVYYQVQLDDIREKIPYIQNPTKRPISFIYTTWDRFVTAEVITDLYDDASYLVDRIYHALREQDTRSVQYWDKAKKKVGFRVLYDGGDLVATSEIDIEEPDAEVVLSRLVRLETGLLYDPQTEHVYFTIEQAKDPLLRDVLDRIHRSAEPVTIRMPYRLPLQNDTGSSAG